MNANEIATKADIENLLFEIKNLQKLLSASNPERKILRSLDVRKLLHISDGTLQRLRITGSLPAQKVNGTWFYKYEDVIKMLS
jgi:hypothetical protein